MQPHRDSHNALYAEHYLLELLVLRAEQPHSALRHGGRTRQPRQPRNNALHPALVVCEDRSLRRGVCPRVRKASGLGLQRLILRRASLACGLHLHERRLDLTQSLAE